MSELKPCPHCDGKAIIKQHKNAIDKDDRPIGGWFVDCEDCGCGTPWHNTEAEATATWNRRVQPDNEPLTLEGLQGMDGEPIWIQGESKASSGWAVMRYPFEFQVARCPNEWNLKYRTDECGKTWQAYRRKPEGGA